MWGRITSFALALSLGLAALPPAAASAAQLAMIAPPLPRGDRVVQASTTRCTADGRHCVASASYIPDVCRVIAAAADASGIDRNFFARLLWKESLFDAAAVSPAGAQGIAQFMPGTAKLRGLADAFNPAEALVVSAAYLSDLTRAYGNLGLAAAAYNGGEARVEKFIAATGGLPLETRAYVQAITGHSAETWRDAPPASVDLALDRDKDFHAACVARAGTRTLREPRAPVMPWGVVVASNRDSAGAERQVARLKHRYGTIIGGETVSYSRGKQAGMTRALHFAQIGRGSRAEAEALCGLLRQKGGDCMVLRN